MVEERLKEIRKKHGLTQKGIACRLNLSAKAYSQYESYAYDMPVDILIKLAVIYNVSADYLACRTDDDTPPEWSDRLPDDLERLREE